MLIPAFLAASAYAQNAGQDAGPVVLPAGTQLPVEIPAHLPMRVGQSVRATLLYPIYADDQLVLPEHSVVNGEIVGLTPDHHHRVISRLRADFTPYYKPVVRFNSIVLANGTVLPVTTGTATDGAPVYRLLATPTSKGSFVSKQIAVLVRMTKDEIHVFTGPDKLDRLRQFAYSQLPYHPQRIAKGTAWTVETESPASFVPQPIAIVPIPPSSATANATLPATGAAKTTAASVVKTPAATDGPAPWILEAYLDTPMSSETSKSGEAIHATVAEPILNADGSIAVPQGSVLTGSVTSARPARRFGRSGQLHFTFRELTRPGQEAQAVRVAMQGADVSTGGDLALDSEGNIKPKPQNKLVVPLILLTLAARPLDREENGSSGGFGRNAVASNSLGLIGFIIGTATQQPNVAAGIGYYGSAISLYERLIAHGKKVAFPKDTRIVLQTTAANRPVLKPNPTP